MDRVEVSSSNIKSIGFDEEKKVLEVEFNNGSVYQFLGVEPVVLSNLMTAESKGSFFHENIREVYETIKVR